MCPSMKEEDREIGGIEEVRLSEKRKGVKGMTMLESNDCEKVEMWERLGVKAKLWSSWALFNNV